MLEEQLKAFLEKVKADTSLQEKVMAADDANAVAAIAKEAGFSISAEDISKAQEDISEEDLANLHGTGRNSRLTKKEWEAFGWWNVL